MFAYPYPSADQIKAIDVSIGFLILACKAEYKDFDKPRQAYEPWLF
jgi:hypothetical protein